MALTDAEKAALAQNPYGESDSYFTRMLGQPKSLSQFVASRSPEAQRAGAKTQAEMAPGIGEVMSAMQAKKNDLEEGKYGSAALNTLFAVPVLGTAGRFGKGMLTGARNVVNRTVQNVPVTIDEFYSNPIAGAKNFAVETAKAIGPTIRESTDPAAVAFRREVGASKRKLQDVIDDTDAEKQLLSINRQIPEDTTGTFVERTFGRDYLDSRIPRENVERIQEGISGGFRKSTSEAIPESIVSRMTNHLVNGPHVKGSRKQYEYQIKDPLASGKAGYQEAIGAARKGAPVSRALYGNNTDKYLETLNKVRGTEAKELSPTDMVEFLQIASTLDKPAMRKLTGKVENQSDMLLAQLLKGRAQKAAGVPFKGTEKGTEELVERFEKLVKDGTIKPARVTDGAGNVVSSIDPKGIKTPEGFLMTQQSFVSRQRELGGMNVAVAVDFNNGKVYTMLSDGHDMYGLDPVGGKGLITASPIIESSYKSKKYNMNQYKTKRTPKQEEMTERAIAERTGVERGTQEPMQNYTARALIEGRQPEVTPADVKRARGARVKLGVTGGGVGAGVTAGMLTGDDE